jgi:predicted PurR-regulated permease PerM
MLHHITYITPVMVMLILLVWRKGFGVTGMEFVGVMPMVQGFVWCDAESLWIVNIPKSKDRFMERPPMKTVQP